MSWAKFERGNCSRWCPPCCFTDREVVQLAGVNCLTQRRSSPGDIGGRSFEQLCGIRQHTTQRRWNREGRQFKEGCREGRCLG